MAGGDKVVMRAALLIVLALSRETRGADLSQVK